MHLLTSHSPVIPVWQGLTKKKYFQEFNYIYERFTLIPRFNDFTYNVDKYRRLVSPGGFSGSYIGWIIM